MEELKRRILQDGLIIDNRILKVDNFLNQQIDANLIINIGKEFARIFLTALSTASSRLNHQVLPSALSQQLLWAIFPSSLHARNALSSCEMPSMHQKCTPTQKKKPNTASISKTYLHEGENVLIVDDFLASGAAALGLADIVKQAGCHIAGIGIVIEKSFQPGRSRLEAAGYRVESLARIAEFRDNKPIFKD